MNFDAAQILTLVLVAALIESGLALQLLVWYGISTIARLKSGPSPAPEPVEPTPTPSPIPVPSPKPADPIPKPDPLPVPKPEPIPEPKPIPSIPIPIPVPPVPVAGPFVKFVGHWSTFGGPSDTGVKSYEDLALIGRSDLNHGHFPNLFLSTQPPGTTGLARALDADNALYIACRWVYSQFGKNDDAAKAYLRTTKATGTNTRTGEKVTDIYCVDWGPGITSRAADLSNALARKLNLKDTDLVEIDVPLPGGVVIPPVAPDLPVLPAGPTQPQSLISGIILDASVDTTPHVQALKAANVRTVLRYLAIARFKNKAALTLSEAQVLASAGIRVGMIAEIGGTPDGHADGAARGTDSVSCAHALGAPPSAVIWYAVDYDAQPSNMSGIIAAFMGFCDAVVPTFRVGVYGGGAVCQEVVAGEPRVTHRWIAQSSGWRGTHAAVVAKQYELLQALNKTIGGIDTDPDTLATPTTDIGDFVPFAAGAPAQEGVTLPAPTSASALALPFITGDNHIKVFGSEAEANAVFGQFTYSNGANGDIIIDPAWVAANIVTIEVPQLMKFKIKNVQCHRLVAAQFIGSWADIERAMLLGWVLSYDGLFVPRHINHNPRLGISRHSRGTAFDINANWNAYGTIGAKPGTTGSTWEIEPYFAKYGFACGRWFGYPHLPSSDTDGMHFEASPEMFK